MSQLSLGGDEGRHLSLGRVSGVERDLSVKRLTRADASRDLRTAPRCFLAHTTQHESKFR